jgi:hypothetical protein
VAVKLPRLPERIWQFFGGFMKDYSFVFVFVLCFFIIIFVVFSFFVEGLNENSKPFPFKPTTFAANYF